MIAESWLWTTEGLNKMINRFLYSLNALSPLKLYRAWEPLTIKLNFSIERKNNME